MVPVFDRLMGTCKRWVSSSTKLGVPREAKQHCKDQFAHLFERQCNVGAITYADMKERCIPLGENLLLIVATVDFRYLLSLTRNSYPLLTYLQTLIPRG